MPVSLEVLAQLLEYPGPQFDRARALPETAPASGGFDAYSRAALEEIYTRTFDLNGDTSLYVGHHLFGDDWRRGLFLAQLNHTYKETGFSCGAELPDHLSPLLRFIALHESGEETEELIHDCVIPAVTHLLTSLRDDENPYRATLQTLLQTLGGDAPETVYETIPCKPFYTSPFPILR